MIINKFGSSRLLVVFIYTCKQGLIQPQANKLTRRIAKMLTDVLIKRVVSKELADEANDHKIAAKIQRARL